MITKATISILSLALCVAVGWGVMVSQSNAALEAKNASLTRSIAVLEGSVAQSRQAAEVAKAEAARVRAQAIEYDAFRSALIKGEQDAELPDWFSDWLNGLLGRMP